MEVTVTERLIGELFASLSPRLASEWETKLADPSVPRVTANGLAVPIIRAEWNHVDDFFDGLFDTANNLFFSGRLPACRRSWNNRFRRVAGRIDCHRQQIELSAPHYEACGTAALGVVLVHEMIHLSLYSDGRPFGHTREFKYRSSSLGLPDVHHELPIPDRLKPRKAHLYRCKCGRIVESRIKFRRPRACAHCCRSFARGRYDDRFRLIYVGQRDSA